MFRGISKFESRRARKKRSQKNSKMWKWCNHELGKQSSHHPITYLFFNFLMHQHRSNTFSLPLSLFRPVIGHRIVYQVLLIVVTKVCHLVHIHTITDIFAAQDCLERVSSLHSGKCIIKQSFFLQRSSFFIRMRSVWHLKAYLQRYHWASNKKVSCDFNSDLSRMNEMVKREREGEEQKKMMHAVWNCETQKLDQRRVDLSRHEPHNHMSCYFVLSGPNIGYC